MESVKRITCVKVTWGLSHALRHGAYVVTWGTSLRGGGDGGLSGLGMRARWRVTF